MFGDVLLEDLEYIVNLERINWDLFKGKTILVTGGTGLIGKNLIYTFLYANEKLELNLTIIALVRDREKAETIFKIINGPLPLRFIEGSVEEVPTINEEIHYVIHGASPTASAYFVEHPVETIKTSVMGTINLLELCVTKKVESFVYLSSMEVYGTPNSGDIIDESQGCTSDTMQVRSCYPVAKRLCESLCASYSSEYGINTKVIRLAQTFGYGVSVYDNRVFAEFARCAISGRDIVLKTDGSSRRCYLYTADAVSGIIIGLLYGIGGEAYNLANSSTYCSILDMARMVASKIGNNKLKIIFDINDRDSSKYPISNDLFLNVDKIKKIGWEPRYELEDMFRRMIKSFNDESC